LASGLREGRKLGGRDLGADTVQNDDGTLSIYLSLGFQRPQFP
jgi:hypothetical protein